MRTVLGALIFCLAAAGQEDPHAQHAHHGGPVGWVPREVLERPVTLRENIGRIHDPVTTASKEAQAFHNQGVAYLHSYVWVEAARSFQQALRHDPKLAMAWLGLSRAYSGLEDAAAARGAQEKAVALAASASKREQRRIELRTIHLEALERLSDAAKHQRYKKAIEDAIVEHMDDLELWLLRGNAEEPSAAGRGQRGGIGSIAFYQAVLARDPGNFAAHHYLVHSYETIGRIPEALKHGEVYSRLASAVPHAHHMYGHDLRRVGRIQDAIVEFEKADELENAYYRAENIEPHYDWHHQHNLDLLSTSYQYQGRMEVAERLMRKAFALPPGTEYLAFNKRELPVFLLARGRNQEALDAANSMKSTKWPLSRAAGHILAGHALLAMGRMEQARGELAAAEKALADRPESRDQRLPSASATVLLDGLRGEILLREGKREEGHALLKDVQRRVRAIPGPDAWSQALFRLEWIARIARELGDWELAESTAQQMLEHDPSYAGTRYALALVAQRKGDKATMRSEFQRATELWKHADSDLQELRTIGR